MQKKEIEENIQIIYQTKKLDFDTQKKIIESICSKDLKKDLERVAIIMRQKTKKQVAERY